MSEGRGGEECGKGRDGVDFQGRISEFLEIYSQPFMGPVISAQRFNLFENKFF